MQRGQTMVRHGFASALHPPEISLQCLALIVALLADVCVHDDISWDGVIGVHLCSKFCCLCPHSGWLGYCSTQVCPGLHSPVTQFDTILFVSIVQTFYPGKRHYARLGGDARAELGRLESQLAEKKVNSHPQITQV